jgi:hypothetical protein
VGAYPEGRIITTIHHYDGSTIIMRAEGYNNDDNSSQQVMQRKFSAHQMSIKLRTSRTAKPVAIGRMPFQIVAIGHTGERASSTEMEKVNRLNTTPNPVGGFATPKQIGYLKSLQRGKNMDDLKLLEFMQHALQVNDVVLETLTFEQASKVISAMKL